MIVRNFLFPGFCLTTLQGVIIAKRNMPINAFFSGTAGEIERHAVYATKNTSLVPWLLRRKGRRSTTTMTMRKRRLQTKPGEQEIAGARGAEVPAA